MKILRKLRRRKIRLSFIFVLLLVFIFNSYAWITTDKTTSLGGLTAEVSSWDIAFIINGDEEIKTEEYTFEIQEFHPGIEPIEKKIEVWNIGDANSFLKYEITDIYLYGIQIYKNENAEGIFVPETLGEETTDETTQVTTANIFGNEEATIFDRTNTYYKFLQEEKENPENNEYKSFSLKYPTPFTITYTYGLTYIAGSKNSGELGSRSEMAINLEWNHEETNNEEDTKLGNLVYDFENAKDANGNLLHEGEPALRIVTRVTANRDLTNTK